MRFKRFFIITLVVLTVATLTVTGFAYPAQRGGMMGRGYYNTPNENYNPLDLNEEQRDKIIEAREKFFDSRNELQVEIRKTNLELRDLMISGGTDEDIANLRNKLNILQNDMLDLRTEYWKQVSDILIDEQLAKVKELFADREDQNTVPGRGNFPGGPGMYGRPGYGGQGMYGFPGGMGMNRMNGAGRMYGRGGMGYGYPGMMGDQDDYPGGYGPGSFVCPFVY